MNLLPVAARELRLMARRPATYRLRCFNAIMATLLSLGLLYAGFGGTLSAASAGRSLFLLLSSLAAVYVLVEGSLMTGDCLSREKREGTLGLLFLTDLRGYDVVAGKLISRTGNSAYALLAALPILGISLFLGGVTGRDFGLMMLALLNGLFYAASFGLLASSICRQERNALGLAVLGTLVLSVGLPVAGWFWSRTTNAGSIPPWLVIGSPAGAFGAVLDSNPRVSTWSVTFAAGLGYAHLAGWTFLVAATIILPRTWRESGRGKGAATARGASRPGVGRLGGRRRPLEQGSIPWEGEGRKSGRPRTRLVFLILVIAWAVGLTFVRSRWLSLPVFAIFVLALHLWLVLVMLLRVCRGPSQDQRTGLLELLLTTPMGEEFYRQGRLLATKRNWAGPLAFVLATDAGLVIAGCQDSGPLNWEWLGWIGIGLILAIKLVVDMYAVAWVGFWLGLRFGSTAQAIRRTVFYVFILKWVLLSGALAAVGLVTQGQFFQSTAGGVSAAVGYLLLSLTTLLHFCGRANTELNDNLRGLAMGLAERDYSPGFFGRLWAATGGRIKRPRRPAVRLRST